MRKLVLIALLLAAARASAAQSNTAEMLQRARRHYDDTDVEQALTILRQVISAASPYVVSPEQYVEAYRYLGASLALLGQAKHDTAVTYFRAAIERDPFVDLDPQRFTPGQLSAFAEARNRTFAVGVRPVAVDTLVPGTAHVSIDVMVTHTAATRVQLRSPSGVQRVVYDGETEGLRAVRWDGLLGDGRPAAAGRYQLEVIGASRLVSIIDTASVYLDVAWLHEPIEDTVPSLGPDQLLPEQFPPSVATGNLLKGLGVAASALLAHTFLASGQLGGENALFAGVLGGATALTGLVSYSARQRNRDIPSNIEANRERLAARTRHNEAVSARNAERLRQARLVVAPATGGAR